MKSKYTYLGLIMLLITCVTTVLTLKNETKIDMGASWAYSYSSIEELKNTADIIVQGFVVSSISCKQKTSDSARFLPTTNHTFIVEKILKGNNDEKTIIIHQTGGTVRGKKMEFTDNPLLTKYTKTILFLRKIAPNYYHIIGGPQGRFIIRNKKVYSIGEVYDKATSTTKPLHTTGIELEKFYNKIQETS